MKRGLIVGKFYPPHAGHHYLIETGKKHCDELHVVVCDRPEHKIPGSLRAKWLRERHPDVVIDSALDTLDDNDSPAWATWAKEYLGGKGPDVVFTSEDYGERWAAEIGCEHYLVDMKRSKHDVSGTRVRANPQAMWQHLSPAVKAHFALRICLVGAESTGKTTLAKALAKHYKTPWVAEYGRTFTERSIPDVWKHVWTDKEFYHIANKQAKHEDMLAREANKVLICDTDVFATSIWYKRYFVRRSPRIEAIAARRPPISLYILTDPKTPFDQDGFRDGASIRQWMHDEFVTSLVMWGKNYIYVTGTHEQRLKTAIKAIDARIAQGTGISGMELHI